MYTELRSSISESSYM